MGVDIGLFFLLSGVLYFLVRVYFMIGDVYFYELLNLGGGW
jgi:hypothetical protein